MPPERKTFTKVERLCSKKVFAEIFEKGYSFYSSPFRVVWIYTAAERRQPSQMAVSVPKRIFKKAVTRNLIKRRIKEAFRKNKHQLYSQLEEKGKQISFVLIYQDNKIPDYKATTKFIDDMLKKFISILKKNDTD